MSRGRPITPITKKEVQILIKKEIALALQGLSIECHLVGTKKKGRPVGYSPKKARK